MPINRRFNSKKMININAHFLHNAVVLSFLKYITKVKPVMIIKLPKTAKGLTF
jgi:hypothetical protein